MHNTSGKVAGYELCRGIARLTLCASYGLSVLRFQQNSRHNILFKKRVPSLRKSLGTSRSSVIWSCAADILVMCGIWVWLVDEKSRDAFRKDW